MGWGLSVLCQMHTDARHINNQHHFHTNAFPAAPPFCYSRLSSILQQPNQAIKELYSFSANGMRRADQLDFSRVHAHTHTRLIWIIYRRQGSGLNRPYVWIFGLNEMMPVGALLFSWWVWQDQQINRLFKLQMTHRGHRILLHLEMEFRNRGPCDKSSSKFGKYVLHCIFPINTFGF